jgi:hypothetical protein
MQPVIDDILQKFISAETEGTTGAARERIRFVDASLRHYLETQGERVLVDDDVTLLHLEREFAADGAFCRTMHADDLVLLVAGYLRAVMPREPLVLRAQLRTVEHLLAAVLRQRLVNAEELVLPLMDARDAIDRGWRELRHPALRRG